MRGAEPQALVRQLGLRTVLPANWCAGLGEVRAQGVFVTPPVAGFVFAVGADLHLAARGGPEALAALLERLSGAFGAAAWFLANEADDVNGWMLAERGSLRRGYVFAGGAGHVFWHGDVTDAERELSCFVDDPRDSSDDEIKWWPDDKVTCAMAAAWSLDPTGLDRAAEAPSVGWCGRL